MTHAQPWTIGRLLSWTADYLRSHGSQSPRLDAEVLLAHARGCQRIDLYTAFAEEPGEDVKSAFREMVRRRAEAVPVAYLVGSKEFFSLPFRVTPDVLIPRPETEHVVVSLLDKARAPALAEVQLQIADVGTGSGILAVCAAKHLPHARVTAVDTSGAALEVARHNAATHGVAERMEFVEGDLLSMFPAQPRFDFILSNPPYIADDEFARLAPDVRLHEPQAALIAGPHGTDVIQRLIPQAADRLQPGGWLMMEISPMIADAVEELIASEDRFGSVELVKDFDQHARVVLARQAP